MWHELLKQIHTPGMAAMPRQSAKKTCVRDVRHLRLVSARSRAKTEPIIARDGAHPGRRQF